MLLNHFMELCMRAALWVLGSCRTTMHVSCLAVDTGSFKDMLKNPCKFRFDEMSHSQYAKLIITIILGLVLIAASHFSLLRPQ